jgi:hypothetical protein
MSVVQCVLRWPRVASRQSSVRVQKPTPDCKGRVERFSQSMALPFQIVEFFLHGFGDRRGIAIIGLSLEDVEGLLDRKPLPTRSTS